MFVKKKLTFFNKGLEFRLFQRINLLLTAYARIKEPVKSMFDHGAT